MRGIKKGVTAFFSVLIIAALGFYFGYYLINYASDSLKMNEAEQVTVYDHIAADGYLIRQEETVGYSGSGVVAIEAEDGQRVAKGGTIAKIYASQEDAANQMQIQALTKKTDALNAALDGVTYGTASLSEIEKEISNISSSISACVNSGDISKLYDLTDTLNIMLSRKNMVLASDEDRQAATTVLEDEIYRLESMTGSASKELTAPKSGYFVSFADGYEELLTLDILDSITPQYLDSIKEVSAPLQDTIGKLVTNYMWAYACTVDHTDTADLERGDKVELSFPFMGDTTLPATIYTITPGGDGRDVIILECSYMTDELTYLRHQSATIIKSTVKGIRVDTLGIRVVDGVTGVYLLRGSTVKFVPVKVIYTAEDYYIVEGTGDGEDEILISDRILVGGKNLYDGKTMG